MPMPDLNPLNIRSLVDYSSNCIIPTGKGRNLGDTEAFTGTKINNNTYTNTSTSDANANADANADTNTDTGTDSDTDTDTDTDIDTNSHANVDTLKSIGYMSPDMRFGKGCVQLTSSW